MQLTAANDQAVLAEEQAALRRLAMLVARQPSPNEVFTAVTEEVGSVLGADFAAMLTFDDDRNVTLIATWSAAGPRPPIGTRLPLDGDSVAVRIHDTGSPARVDSYADVGGETAQFARDLGVRSTVGAPILVGGKLWGALLAATRGREPLPETAEARIAAFTELVSTTISNAEARHELQRVGAEQEALRKAATLVAAGVTPTEVFAAITASAAEVFGVPFATLIRVGPDETATMVAGCAASSAYVGTTWTVPADDPGITRTVVDSCRPSRIEDHSRVYGPVGEAARALGVGSVVGAPVIVEGSAWGVLAVGAAQNGPPLAPDAADRLANFAELVSTAIVNTEARDQVRRLLDEQAALRRIATLVAEGTAPKDVFDAVRGEVAEAFDTPFTVLWRFDPDGLATVLASDRDYLGPAGSRWPLEGDTSVAARVRQTGRAARVDFTAPGHARGSIAEAAQRSGVRYGVGVPIVVEGELWGAMNVGSERAEPLPADIERRLERFTELLATAIANAQSKSELAASRMRIVTASDEARRRIERDLHDGAQQQLVTLALAMRSTEGRIPTGQEELKEEVGGFGDRVTSVVEELREMSRGIHPAILSEGGLAPALEALALRSAVPVKLNVRHEQRLPDAVEVAAYYVASEALTNASKHADASRVEIDLDLDDASLRLSICDDGGGGADPSRGSGLIGLKDRVEALGGTIDVVSPHGRGTRLRVAIPVLADSAAR